MIRRYHVASSNKKFLRKSRIYMVLLIGKMKQETDIARRKLGSMRKRIYLYIFLLLSRRFSL